MGQVASSFEVWMYHRDRTNCRRELIKKIISDPNNKQILDDCRDLRGLILRDVELCATAFRESQYKYDVSPTCMESAEFELKRLYDIFERGRLLKSAKIRDHGKVACPYMHVMTEFHENYWPTCYAEDENITCNICNIQCDPMRGGYCCEYCEYNLCDICCVIYCAEGHEMKLWTNGDGDFTCSVCKTDPITAGYHCPKCVVDICDLCTYKPGRAAVQAFQIEEIADLIEFMSDFTDESWTAKRLCDRHEDPKTKQAYLLSTLTLHNYVYELRTGKDDTQEETKQHRIWKEVIRLREVIAEENNAVARRELKNVGNFTEFEISRLNRVIAVSERARSVFGRREYYCGCPVGHYAAPFKGIPPAWYRLNRPPLCAVCERIAEAGCYCPVCEYALCQTCEVVYCYEGHDMVMWTEPEVVDNIVCLVCKKDKLRSGYHCGKCNTDICDACTSKEGRELLKADKVELLKQLSKLILKYKNKSDMAFSYRNKHIPYITSMKVLVQYIKELERDMIIAERQYRYYIYICKMKSLLRRITKYNALCLSARIEMEMFHPYNFENLKQVKYELDRLKNIIDTQRFLCSVAARVHSTIACPLGHCMNHNILDCGMLVDTQPELSAAKHAAAMNPTLKPAKAKSTDVSVTNTKSKTSAGGTKKKKRGVGSVASELDIDSSIASILEGDQLEGDGDGSAHVVVDDEQPQAVELDQIREEVEELEKELAKKKKKKKKKKAGKKKSVDNSASGGDNSVAVGGDNSAAADNSGVVGVDNSVVMGDSSAVSGCDSSVSVDGENSEEEDEEEEDDVDDEDWDEETKSLPNHGLMMDVTMVLDKTTREHKHFLCSVCSRQINTLTEADHRVEMVRASAAMPVRCIEDLSPFPPGAPLPQEPANLSVAASVAPTAPTGVDDATVASVTAASVTSNGLISLASNVSVTSKSKAPRKPMDVEGCYCGFCDYALCSTCTTVYCRQGHPCKLWTLPEAVGHQCDICYTTGITMGYHCNECDVDICDMCTTRETRNVLLMIPKRNFKEIYKYLESNRLISATAMAYCMENPPDLVAEYMQSMSRLCEELRRLEAIKVVCDKEIEAYNLLTKQRKYAISSNDF